VSSEHPAEFAEAFASKSPEAVSPVLALFAALEEGNDAHRLEEGKRVNRQDSPAAMAKHGDKSALQRQ